MEIMLKNATVNQLTMCMCCYNSTTYNQQKLAKITSHIFPILWIPPLQKWHQEKRNRGNKRIIETSQLICSFLTLIISGQTSILTTMWEFGMVWFYIWPQALF